MNDAEFINFVEQNRIFASLRADSANSALRAAEAAIIGGIKLIEVSLATPGEFRVISELCRLFGDRACIGAGSVTGEEQIDRAVKSGAEFISLSFTNNLLIDACRRRRVFPLVGALTPTEVFNVWVSGLPLITVFPASLIGGADYIAALTARMNGIRLVASGDVGPENISDYFSSGAFAISVDKRLFARGDLQNENYVAIAERARGIRIQSGVSL
jgi:2-dehydro-3-deoxyphosphogluconate aldolase / (4S)-4-hydroxy-2-oxoglutarate aldolase